MKLPVLTEVGKNEHIEKQISNKESTMLTNQEEFGCENCWRKAKNPEFCRIFVVTISRALIERKSEDPVLTKPPKLVLKTSINYIPLVRSGH